VKEDMQSFGKLFLQTEFHPTHRLGAGPSLWTLFSAIYGRERILTLADVLSACHE
jgi:hypothetical protein